MKGYTNAKEKPITVTTLSVSENGDYTAPSGSAYGSVTVNVAGGGAVLQLALATHYHLESTLSANSRFPRSYSQNTTVYMGGTHSVTMPAILLHKEI